MKKIISILMAEIMLIALCACGENRGGVNSDNKAESTTISHEEENQINIDESSITLIPINNTGMISYDKLGFDNRYSYATGLRSENNSDDGLFVFKYNGKYGYVDDKGNIVIDNIYEKANAFSEGKAFVKPDKDTPWQIIDTKGDTLLSLDSDLDASGRYFINGKVVFYKLHDLLGEFTVNTTIIDDSLNIANLDFTLGANYERNSMYYITTDSFSGFIIKHYNSRKDSFGIYTVYTESGERIWDYDELKMSQTIGNITNVNNRLKKRFLTSDSAFSTIDCANLICFKNGYMNVMNEDGKWALFDIHSRNAVIDFSYDYVGEYSDNVFQVCSYGKWGVIDLKKTMIIDYQFDYIGPFNKGVAFAQKDDMCGFIDKSGTFVSNIDNLDTFNTHYYDVFDIDSDTGLCLFRIYSAKYLEKAIVLDSLYKSGDPILLSLSYDNHYSVPLSYYSDKYIFDNNNKILYQIQDNNKK